MYTAKLIDFDDSYLAGQPPSPDTVVGDTLYGAPEWLSYIQGEGRADGTRLTTAVDMFALGLMLHEYLTGERPGFPSTFSSPWRGSQGRCKSVHEPSAAPASRYSRAGPDRRESTPQTPHRGILRGDG